MCVPLPRLDLSANMQLLQSSYLQKCPPVGQECLFWKLVRPHGLVYTGQQAQQAGCILHMLGQTVWQPVPCKQQLFGLLQASLTSMSTIMPVTRLCYVPRVTCCRGASDPIDSDGQKTKDDCTCTSKDTVSDAAVGWGPDVHQLVRAEKSLRSADSSRRVPLIYAA